MLVAELFLKSGQTVTIESSEFSWKTSNRRLKEFKNFPPYGVKNEDTWIILKNVVGFQITEKGAPRPASYHG